MAKNKTVNFYERLVFAPWNGIETYYDVPWPVNESPALLNVYYSAEDILKDQNGNDFFPIYGLTILTQGTDFEVVVVEGGGKIHFLHEPADVNFIMIESAYPYVQTESLPINYSAGLNENIFDYETTLIQQLKAHTDYLFKLYINYIPPENIGGGRMLEFLPPNEQGRFLEIESVDDYQVRGSTTLVKTTYSQQNCLESLLPFLGLRYILRPTGVLVWDNTVLEPKFISSIEAGQVLGFSNRGTEGWQLVNMAVSQGGIVVEPSTSPGSFLEIIDADDQRFKGSTDLIKVLYLGANTLKTILPFLCEKFYATVLATVYDLQVEGDSQLDGDLTVLGVTSLKDVTTETLTSTVSADLPNTLIDGDLTVNDNLTVAGNSDFTGTVNIAGNTTISSDLNVEKTLNVEEDLNVTGDTTFAGSAYFNDSTDFKQNANFEKNIDIAGEVTTTSLVVEDITATKTINAASLKSNNDTIKLKKFYVFDLQDDAKIGDSLIIYDIRTTEIYGDTYVLRSSTITGGPGVVINVSFNTYSVGDGSGGLKDGDLKQDDNTIVASNSEIHSLIGLGVGKTDNVNALTINKIDPNQTTTQYVYTVFDTNAEINDVGPLHQKKINSNTWMVYVPELQIAGMEVRKPYYVNSVVTWEGHEDVSSTVYLTGNETAKIKDSTMENAVIGDGLIRFSTTQQNMVVGGNTLEIDVSKGKMVVCNYSRNISAINITNYKEVTKVLLSFLPDENNLSITWPADWVWSGGVPVDATIFRANTTNVIALTFYEDFLITATLIKIEKYSQEMDFLRIIGSAHENGTMRWYNGSGLLMQSMANFIIKEQTIENSAIHVAWIKQSKYTTKTIVIAGGEVNIILSKESPFIFVVPHNSDISAINISYSSDMPSFSFTFKIIVTPGTSTQTALPLPEDVQVPRDLTSIPMGNGEVTMIFKYYGLQSIGQAMTVLVGYNKY